MNAPTIIRTIGTTTITGSLLMSSGTDNTKSINIANPTERTIFAHFLLPRTFKR